MRDSLSPNVLRAGWSIVRSLVTVRSPKPQGGGEVDHGRYAKILETLEGDVIRRLPDVEIELSRYLEEMESTAPDELDRDQALAYWMNVYNAAALRLGSTAARASIPSVFGIPGAFTDPVVHIDGERLSLDQLEHGKVRRFADPRIHAGLVCGALSCPTLRREPFDGRVGAQLGDQMRQFLASGGLRIDRAKNRVVLTPIFSWYGRDFVRPTAMPSLLPVGRRRVLDSVLEWTDVDSADWIRAASPSISYSGYDWQLGCVIG